MHTPGPWIIELHWDDSTLNFSLESSDLGNRNSEDFRRFATGTLWVNGLDCREGDARLIATAPRLLEACKAFLDVWHRAGPLGSHQFEKFDHAVRLAEAAIAEAEGVTL